MRSSQAYSFVGIANEDDRAFLEQFRIVRRNILTHHVNILLAVAASIRLFIPVERFPFYTHLGGRRDQATRY